MFFYWAPAIASVMIVAIGVGLFVSISVMENSYLPASIGIPATLVISLPSWFMFRKSREWMTLRDDSTDEGANL